MRFTAMGFSRDGAKENRCSTRWLTTPHAGLVGLAAESIAARVEELSDLVLENA